MLFRKKRLFASRPVASLVFLAASLGFLHAGVHPQANGGEPCSSAPDVDLSPNTAFLRDVFFLGESDKDSPQEVIRRAASAFEADSGNYSSAEIKKEIRHQAGIIPRAMKERIDKEVEKCLASDMSTKECGEAADKLFGKLDNPVSGKWSGAIYFFSRACDISDNPVFCGVAENLSSKGKEYQEKKNACDRGDGGACFELAKLLGPVPGQLTPPPFPSKKLFFAALEKGCAGGDLDSCIVGALSYQREGNLLKMGDLISRACDMGDAGSCYIAGGLFEVLGYEQGGGNPKLRGEIEKLSERMYRKACQLGQTAACVLLRDRKKIERQLDKIRRKIMAGEDVNITREINISNLPDPSTSEEEAGDINKSKEDL